MDVQRALGSYRTVGAAENQEGVIHFYANIRRIHERRLRLMKNVAQTLPPMTSS